MLSNFIKFSFKTLKRIIWGRFPNPRTDRGLPWTVGFDAWLVISFSRHYWHGSSCLAAKDSSLQSFKGQLITSFYQNCRLVNLLYSLSKVHATVLDKWPTGSSQANRSLELHADFGHGYSSNDPNSTFLFNCKFSFLSKLYMTMC